MQKCVLICALILAAKFSLCQTTSTNFEVADCNGEMYSLYDDLDNGNVVVIAWVMPCVSCIQHPLETYQIVENYDPQKVKFFMVDDYTDHDCSDIQAWSEDYQMGSCKKFVNSAITMNDYGTHGMPKIVVTGCKSHKVFFNKNSSSSGVKAAIDAAIAECNATSITESSSLSSELAIYPNPISEKTYFSIKNSSATMSLSISNLLGIEVFHLEEYISKNPIDLGFLSEGVYLTKIISNNTIYSKLFVVSK